MWAQSRYYLQSQGDHHLPTMVFLEDILEAIHTWIQEGSNVILAINANQNVYQGALAQRLSQFPYYMECAVEKCIGAQVPNSHHRGSEPISTIFCISGISPRHAMVYPHWYGIGDHRVFILELSARNLFGGTYPKIALPK